MEGSNDAKKRCRTAQQSFSERKKRKALREARAASNIRIMPPEGTEHLFLDGEGRHRMILCRASKPLLNLWHSISRNCQINFRAIGSTSHGLMHFNLGKEDPHKLEGWTKLVRTEHAETKEKIPPHLVDKRIGEIRLAEEAVTGLLVDAFKGIGVNVEEENIDWVASMLFSSYSVRQRPHLDYAEEIFKKKPRTWARGLPFEEWVPYVLVFPITHEGMELEVWPWSGSAGAEPNVVGQRIKIEQGQALLFRGDVLHAGGYKTDKGEMGNKRVHLYVYINGAVAHDPSLMTHWRDSSGAFWDATHTGLRELLEQKPTAS